MDTLVRPGPGQTFSCPDDLDRYLQQLISKPTRAQSASLGAVGWNGDFLDARAFGHLAVRSVRHLPLSLPTTIGVPHPMRGDELHRAA
ncbi:hypothetical protein [Microvirga sp. 2TAF3]|uniref:hypothetical protein n=1 Tax=Microvirga sp. 2TAF3 TaxID=3233014 RepID=UPI003F9BAD75